MQANPSIHCDLSFGRIPRQLALVLVILAFITGLNGCGGNSFAGGNNNASGNSSDWMPGVFLPASTFRSICTATNENNYLRSFSNDTYLWYDEIVDRDPALSSTPAYFDLLKTNALTSSGNSKDNFHFSIPTDEWLASSQSGISVGYGAQFALLETTPPRRTVVADIDPNTPAAANLSRGAEILTIDGVDVVNGSDFDALNAGLFPDNAGETHTFRVRDVDNTVRTFTMQSAVITSPPVKNVSTIPTASGNVGYLQFNDHNAVAEGGLFNAVTQLTGMGITDLVIDIRYNSGGFLDIASEFSYMIAGAARTTGQTFEAITFNDKHPNTNPITGEALTPTPFFTRSLGFDPSLASGTLLPTLDLARVFVLTGSDTCSASESIINSLRGVDVEVVQIGSTTCGKPYGFFPTSNCGTTYFTIQFQGVNAKGFGEYSDGFSPANSIGNVGTLVPGCSVGDDFSTALGDPVEARLSAALNYRDTGSCPTASGFSGSGLSRVGLLPSEKMIVPRTLWQQNRIMSP